MRIRTLNLATLAILATVAHSGSAPSIEVSRVAGSKYITAPASNFTGTVRLQSQFRRDAPSRLGGALVHFDAGARTNWHTHPVGQTLVVTAGTGHVQQWGGKRETITEGDIVWIPPNVKHWHGASAEASMSHAAILETLDGKSVDWMEKVTDEQYSLSSPACAGTDPGCAR